MNQWQKGRYLGGSDHNKIAVKEALDLFTLGEEVVMKGGVVEEVMKRRNKGKRAMEFGRDFGEADAGYDEEEYEDDEDEEDMQQRLGPSAQEMGAGIELETESEDENGTGFVDLSVVDLDNTQMSWSAWKGGFEICSEGSDDDED